MGEQSRNGVVGQTECSTWFQRAAEIADGIDEEIRGLQDRIKELRELRKRVTKVLPPRPRMRRARRSRAELAGGEP